ncbi:DNA repair protein RadA, partial [Candidatus Peregrinibacteria bacterium CG11_big_fil_rev_8_21_14_0_20_46_8]
MAKSSIIYTCTECSHQAPKWEGRCQQCESWGTLMEGEKMAPTQRDKKIAAHARSPKEFTSVLASLSKSIATATGIEELDRVLGGGIVDGALILLTGEPGIGKSTLTLQIANALSQQSKKILYISGEESEEQISLRGQRLNLQLQNLHILAEQNLESVIATAEQEKPELLIIDSIQVMSSGALPGGGGGTSQVRFCTEQLLEFAKPRNIPVLIIGHVTKDGNLAGPRVLEHLVDTVLYFEGSRSHELRMLRPVKNRFGSTQEVGIFAMDSKGLQPIDNVQDFFLKDRHAGQIGTCLVATMEGSRPIIVEVQALTNKTA